MGTATILKGTIRTENYGKVEIFFEDFRYKDRIRLAWYALDSRMEVIAEAETKAELYKKLGV